MNIAPIHPLATPAPDQVLDRRLLIGAAGLAGVAVLNRLSSAGPLTPPLGAVGPTGKTTQEIFDRVGQSEARTPVTQATCPGDAGAVFVISQRGSYYLTGNIAVPIGLMGVRLNAAPITLDLNGFAIVGATGGGSLESVGVGGESPDAVVRNGWCGAGLSQGVRLGVRGLVEDVRVEVRGANSPSAISVATGTVRRCAVKGGYFGVRVGAGGELGERVIESCTAEGSVYGLVLTGAGRISRSTVVSPTYSGIVIEGSSAGSLVEACVVQLSEAESGFFGIEVFTPAARVSNCAVAGNPSRPGFLGIKMTGEGGIVDGCTVKSVTTGIMVQDEALIANCVIDNTTDGISCGGIKTTIRDNTIIRATAGIRLDGGTRNIVFRNTLADTLSGGVTNLANNVVAPFANVSSTTLTNPLANLPH